MPSNEWLTVSKYALSLASREPWGLAHAKRMGEDLAACGFYAEEFNVVWPGSFDGSVADACPDCVREVLADHGETAGSGGRPLRLLASRTRLHPRLWMALG